MTDTSNAIDHIRLQLKARNEVLLRKFTTLYNLKFELGLMGKDPFGHPLTELRDQIRALKKQVAENAKVGDNYDYLWVTVGIDPKWCDKFLAPHQPAISMEDRLKEMNSALLKKANKYANSAMFEEYIYVMEQRESQFVPSEVYVGQHFHFLLRRNPAYVHSQIIRNTKNMWRKFCDVKNPQILKIIRCPAEYVKDKIEYCLGKKTGVAADGEDKSVHQVVDAQFRSYYNIEKFYASPENSFLSE